jgi:hypothetical protein
MWTAKSLQEMPAFVPTMRYRVASLSHLGRRDEARDVVCQLLLVSPDAIIISLQPHCLILQSAGILDALLGGLRQAGLPEGGMVR